MSVLLISCQNFIMCAVNEDQNYVWMCNIIYIYNIKNTFGVFVCSKLKYVYPVYWSLKQYLTAQKEHLLCGCFLQPGKLIYNILFYVARYAHHVIHQPHHQTFLMHSWLFQGCQQVEKNSVLHHQVI